MKQETTHRCSHNKLNNDAQSKRELETLAAYRSECKDKGVLLLKRRNQIMSKQELEKVAQSMVAKGKGILAADESMGTIKRRFDSIKIESNDHNRRAYRDMLFTTKGIEEAIRRCDPFRRDHPNRDLGRHAVSPATFKEGHHARYQSR